MVKHCLVECLENITTIYNMYNNHKVNIVYKNGPIHLLDFSHFVSTLLELKKNGYSITIVILEWFNQISLRLKNHIIMLQMHFSIDYLSNQQFEELKDDSSDWKNNYLYQFIPSYELKLIEMNYEASPIIQTPILPSNPGWYFVQYINGEKTSYLSKHDSVFITGLYQQYRCNGKRKHVMITGKNGFDLYLIIFHPQISDKKWLEERFKLGIHRWNSDKKSKNNDNWRKILLDPSNHVYVNMSNISPVRILRCLPEPTDPRYKRYHVTSEKDLEIYNKEGFDDNVIASFLEGSKEEYEQSRKIGLTIVLPENPVVMWKHRSGWKLMSGDVTDTILDNLKKCINYQGMLMVGYDTGKDFKSIDFRRKVDPQLYQDNQDFLHFMIQIDVDGKSNERIIGIIDESSLDEIQRFRLKLYSSYPHLTTYQIESVVNERTMIPKDYLEKMEISYKHIIDQIFSIPPEEFPYGKNKHVLYRYILDLLNNDDRNIFSIITLIRSNGVKCPLSFEIFETPMIAPDGYTYEKKMIEEHLRYNGKSPMTRQNMSIMELRNDTVTKKIMNLLIVD